MNFEDFIDFGVAYKIKSDLSREKQKFYVV